jgi:hypothetical protein
MEGGDKKKAETPKDPGIRSGGATQAGLCRILDSTFLEFLFLRVWVNRGKGERRVC